VRTVSERLDELAVSTNVHREQTVAEFCAKLRRLRVAKLDPKLGRFNVGDHVRWRARVDRPVREGIVVEVVARGRYPGRQHTTLVPHGYYRETESYVVESEGRAFWPRVGNLERVG
jgi:hypothetical protein